MIRALCVTSICVTVVHMPPHKPHLDMLSSCHDAIIDLRLCFVLSWSRDEADACNKQDAYAVLRCMLRWPFAITRGSVGKDRSLAHIS